MTQAVRAADVEVRRATADDAHAIDAAVRAGGWTYLGELVDETMRL